MQVLSSSCKSCHATSDIHNSLQWIDNMQLLHNWLDAVAVNPGQFCVPCMARASIAGSLQPPREAEGPAAMLSVDSLAMPSFMIRLIHPTLVTPPFTLMQQSGHCTHQNWDLLLLALVCLLFWTS
jgi:hypothetical protein